uniref:NmrA-like family domain-containing protein 1 n=1 Tax=Leptobrachium leishanense TaxID=445787 RepID=A0A8C5R3F4_9ANUR
MLCVSAHALCLCSHSVSLSLCHCSHSVSPQTPCVSAHTLCLCLCVSAHALCLCSHSVSLSLCHCSRSVSLLTLCLRSHSLFPVTLFVSAHTLCLCSCSLSLLKLFVSAHTLCLCSHSVSLLTLCVSAHALCLCSRSLSLLTLCVSAHALCLCSYSVSLLILCVSAHTLCLCSHSVSLLTLFVSAQAFCLCSYSVSLLTLCVSAHTLCLCSYSVSLLTLFVSAHALVSLLTLCVSAHTLPLHSHSASPLTPCVCANTLFLSPSASLSGAQGGSVVRAFLEDGTFAVRAVTRDTSKPAARKLKEAGAEVVAADLDDKKSLEAALCGAYGAFLVTDFWQHCRKEKEVAQGQLFAKISKSLDLKHVVFSGLEHVKKLTGGKLEVLHFDGKGELEVYFRSIGVPMTSVRLPGYYENMLTSYRPQKTEDGTYTLRIPVGDVPFDGLAVDDVGPIVVSILKSPSKYIGKDIGVSADKLTVEQYAAILSKVTGKTFKDAKISPDEYETLGFPEAKQMANMFRFCMMKLDRDVELTLKLNPKAKRFQQWAEENKDLFRNL